jgi:hypothetical protein
MPHPILATIGDALAGGFGATAALLLIGGGVLLRWQRARYHFTLAQSALDKGLSPATAGPPAWLVSLRQSVLVLATGVGLMIAGGAVAAWASNVPPPPANSPTTAPAVVVEEPPSPPGPGGPERRPPQPPPRPDPAREQWDRAQDAFALALAGLASGGILSLLGVVRIAFVVVERRHESSLPKP